MKLGVADVIINISNFNKYLLNVLFILQTCCFQLQVVNLLLPSGLQSHVSHFAQLQSEEFIMNGNVVTLGKSNLFRFPFCAHYFKTN